MIREIEDLLTLLKANDILLQTCQEQIHTNIRDDKFEVLQSRYDLIIRQRYDLLQKLDKEYTNGLQNYISTL